MSAIVRRWVVLALCLTAGFALVGAPQVASAAPVSAADGGIPTRTVLTSTNFHPLVGQAYSIRGQVQLVSATDGAPATYTPFPKQPVTLQLCTAACYSKTPTWKSVATTTTAGDTKAMFAFPLVARTTRVYRVVFDGSKYLGIIGSSAGAILIQTHRSVTTSLRQPRPGHFTMSGRIRPSYARQPVYLMRRSCSSCAFKTVQRSRSSATGGYRFGFGSPTRTSLYVVRARASNGLAVSYSKLAKILVR